MMHRHQHNPCCSSILLLLQLLLVSFVIFPPTAAFVSKRSASTSASIRILQHHRVDDDIRFRCGSSNSNSKTRLNAEERQDAYGRTIRNDSDSEVNNGLPNDPLAATSTTSPSSSNNNNPNLDPLVVCGPSGVGKGTVIESLRNRFPPDVFGFSVSHTTRQPRPGEIDGQHYTFTTKEKIQTDIDQGLFVEHALVHGNYYGTSKTAIQVLQEEGKITILDIDMQGVKSVKESGISARYVFIAPPSRQELEDRLRGRGTETEEAIAKRLGNAAKEIEYGEEEGNFDKIFVNQDVEETVDEMVEVLSEWFPQLKSSSYAPETKEEPTQQQQQHKSPAKSPPREQPFDFLAESDRMLRFPSVRKGHGRLVMAPDDVSPAERRRLELNARHMGAYTVDLEESDSNPRLGNTNPNIALDSEGFDGSNDNSSAGVPETKKGQPKKRGMFTAGRSTDKEKQQERQNSSESKKTLYSSSFVDNEEPDGPRGYPRLGKTNPTTFLDSRGSNGDDDEITYFTIT